MVNIEELTEKFYQRMARRTGKTPAEVKEICENKDLQTVERELGIPSPYNLTSATGPRYDDRGFRILYRDDFERFKRTLRIAKARYDRQSNQNNVCPNC